MNRFLFVLLGLLLAAGAQAQAIYKYRLPDGRVVYSDKPVPGAKLEDELEPPPPPSDPEAAKRRAREEAAAAKSAAKPAGKTLDQAWEDLRFWNRKLEEARAALEAGREPLEGERIGTAGGKARMNDSYWQRQQANTSAVAQAEARAKQAQDRINQLR